MGKLKNFAEYVTKDMDAPPPPPPAPVNPVKCTHCGYTDVPDPGHVCHMCHTALPVAQPSPDPGMRAFAKSFGVNFMNGINLINEALNQNAPKDVVDG